MLRRTRNASTSSRPFSCFNDTATTQIYTLSLHDALPISLCCLCLRDGRTTAATIANHKVRHQGDPELFWHGELNRSEEHTSELQSRLHLVCRLLLEKKNRSSSPPSVRRSSRKAATAGPCV